MIPAEIFESCWTPFTISTLEIRYYKWFCYIWSEMAKVHTSFIRVEVQILVFKNTLVKVLTKLLYSSKSKEALKCT